MNTVSPLLGARDNFCLPFAFYLAQDAGRDQYCKAWVVLGSINQWLSVMGIMMAIVQVHTFEEREHSSIYHGHSCDMPTASQRPDGSPYWSVD